MPFARRPDPVSPRVWARLGRPDVDPAREDSLSRSSEPALEPSSDNALATTPSAIHRRRVAPDPTPPPRRERPIRVEVPRTLRTGRWVPPRRAALGLVLVAVAVSLVFGVRIAWALADTQAPALSSGARAGPSITSTGQVASGGLSGGSTGATGSTGSGTARAGAGLGGLVVVHVVGAVGHPGLVTLPAGSRVADAITAAGGATSEADLGAINVARLLVDGEQVRVPRPGEVITGVGGAPGGASTGASGRAGAGLISLNSADVATLDTLPGVGPMLAQRIVDWRTAHGRFTSVDELGEVTGIGEKLLAQITPLVTV